MPAEPNPDCSACKENKWWVKNGPERVRETEYYRMQLKQMAAKVASLEADMEFDAWKRKDTESWAQAKVREQAKALKILNEKLSKKEKFESTQVYLDDLIERAKKWGETHGT